MYLLRKVLERLIVRGTLTVVDAAGRTDVFRGAGDGPAVAIRLHSRWLPRRLALNPDLSFGEAFMDGTLTVEHGDIHAVVSLLMENADLSGAFWVRRFRRRLARLFRLLQQFNPDARSRRNVAHHYDLSGDLYRLFLDTDLQYSCAYFRDADEPLEDAQRNKRVHIAAKLLLDRPGLSVLDIGSGWGGLAMDIARMSGAAVTGVTLSTAQLAVAEERVRNEGLGDVRFRLQDYRRVEGAFDRIVSVGMFEHVGVGHYPEFFATCRRLLKDDGVALLHTIGRASGPAASNPWIRKYIFPGGYSPALSEVVQAIEAAGLWITDVEVLRYHYADTLRAWRRRFMANRARAVELYDERFARMWEFYLAASEAAFRISDHVVFQVQFARSKDAVPDRRDYIDRFDRRREADSAAA
ncbi:MAG: cyclopropane-fatty-acyl-phospholipid synthase [Proteobacteria bacterium]|nr:cyclopropane-fatty-acyl-phospholipid synthase [Pseudomonadota bacterium]